jgi:hypothetical protein
VRLQGLEVIGQIGQLEAHGLPPGISGSTAIALN